MRRHGSIRFARCFLIFISCLWDQLLFRVLDVIAVWLLGNIEKQTSTAERKKERRLLYSNGQCRRTLEPESDGIFSGGTSFYFTSFFFFWRVVNRPIQKERIEEDVEAARKGRSEQKPEIEFENGGSLNESQGLRSLLTSHFLFLFFNPLLVHR